MIGLGFNRFLKIFLSIIILSTGLQSLTKADDIGDFEIEEISIGASALNFFSLNELKSSLSIPPNLENSEYDQSCFGNMGNTYDRVCIGYKRKDKKKTIDFIQGQIIYKKEVHNICRKKQKEIDKELSQLFVNLERVDWGKLMLTALKDIDPDAYYHPITYEFDDKSRAQVGCYFINNHTRLKVGVYTYEYGLVIRN